MLQWAKRMFHQRTLLVTSIIVVTGLVLIIIAVRFLFIKADTGTTVTNVATLYYTENGVNKSVQSNQVTTQVLAAQTSPTPGESSPPSSNVVNLKTTIQGRTDTAGLITHLKFNQGATTTAEFDTTLTADGSVTASLPSNLTLGQTYSVSAKPKFYLTQTLNDIVLAASTELNYPTTFRGGDLMGDNNVNSMDFALMNANWLGANPLADINADGMVNSMDFAILNSNFGAGM